MPIFDYRCPECGAEKKDEFVSSWDTVVKCDECEAEMEKIPSRFSPDIFPADGIHLKNVSATGKTFYSKKEMKKYAKDNDLDLGAL